MRIGLLGGTFDPVHNGHLHVAQAAEQRHGLDRMVFVPARLSPLKMNSRVTPAETRLRMAAAAVASRPGWEVSRVEIDRPAPSYTIDTVEAFRRDDPGAEVYFILGADALSELSSWYRARELVRVARFVAVARPGWSLSGIDALAEALGAEAADGMKRDAVRVEGVAVSASEIRRRVREGRPITGLVPEAVEKLIRDEGLYRAG